jgi:hypothetical protein
MKTATIAFQFQRPGDALRVRWVQVTESGASHNQEPEPESLQAMIEALQRHAATRETDCGNG